MANPFAPAGGSVFGVATSTSALGSAILPFGGAAAPTFGAIASGGTQFGGAAASGSRHPVYFPTPADQSEIGTTSQAGKFFSISAMPFYANKNPDELRWEDYRQGDKGGPAPAQATREVFGQAAAGVVSHFGAAAAGVALEFVAIRGTQFGAAVSGSRYPVYTPIDTPAFEMEIGTPGKFFSISAMPFYENKSPDELRWEDYQGGDRGGPAPAQATREVFGQAAADVESPFSGPAAGVAPAFRGTQFGGAPASGSRYPVYTPIDTPADEFEIGTTSQAGKFVSISAMRFYENKNPDELRWEDYQGGDRGEPAPAQATREVFGQAAAGVESTFSGPAAGVAPAFGGTQFGRAAASGSRYPVYTPIDTPADEFEIGTTSQAVKFVSISAMRFYENKNPDELRWEDYQGGDRGGPAPAQATGELLRQAVVHDSSDSSDSDSSVSGSESESSHPEPDIPSALLTPSFAPSVSQFRDVWSAFSTGFGGALPRIPNDVVEAIIECADYYVKDTSVRSDRMSGRNWEKTYVVSQPVNFEKGRIKEIRVDAEAHDQGWSSYPEDQNTYNNSWTYAELARMLPDGSLSSSRESFYRNLHANEDWQHHSKTWSAESSFVQSLQAGDKVAVVLRAQFPGWEHYVRWAKLEIVYMSAL